MVRNVSVGPGWQQEWPAPIRDREWVASDGTAWRMRGGPIDERAVRKLLKATRRQVAPCLRAPAVADFRDVEHNVLLVVEESC